MKLGRRSADVLLLDILGTVRAQKQITYDVPIPSVVFGFLHEATAEFRLELSKDLRKRISGIGIATPYELWSWIDKSNSDTLTHQSWQNIDFAEEVAEFSDLPVFVANDATAACRAEHLFGRGKEFDDYGYFFVGSYVGGGIVLDESVYEGKRGNAGALGSMRSTGPQGESRQLVDVASIHLLEKRLQDAGIDTAILLEENADWSDLKRYVDPWLGQTAQELSKAALSACSVIDFEAILIDGSFPTSIRERLTTRTRRYIENQDTRGLIPPKIESGSIGGNARAIGAAAGPLFAQFFLDSKSGFSKV